MCLLLASIAQLGEHKTEDLEDPYLIHGLSSSTIITMVIISHTSHGSYILHLLQLIHVREMEHIQTVLPFSCRESTVQQLRKFEPFLARFYDSVTSVTTYRISA